MENGLLESGLAGDGGTGVDRIIVSAEAVDQRDLRHGRNFDDKIGRSFGQGRRRLVHGTKSPLSTVAAQADRLDDRIEKFAAFAVRQTLLDLEHRALLRDRTSVVEVTRLSFRLALGTLHTIKKKLTTK